MDLDPKLYRAGHILRDIGESYGKSCVLHPESYLEGVSGATSWGMPTNNCPSLST